MSEAVTDEMALLPCPFCGAEASLVHPFGSLEPGSGKPDPHALDRAKATTLSQRIYANGYVGVIVKINGIGEPDSLYFECLDDNAVLIGEFGTAAAAIAFADRYKATHTALKEPGHE